MAILCMMQLGCMSMHQIKRLEEFDSTEQRVKHAHTAAKIVAQWTVCNSTLGLNASYDFRETAWVFGTRGDTPGTESTSSVSGSNFACGVFSFARSTPSVVAAGDVKTEFQLLMAYCIPL